MGADGRRFVWCGCVTAALALGSAPAASPLADPAGGDALIQHLSSHTVAEVGRTRVIAFRASTPTATDRAFAAVVSDPALL